MQPLPSGPVQFVSAERREVLILRNPRAGARDGERLTHSLQTMLTDQGFPAEEFTDIDALADEVRRRTDLGTLRAVVSAGGDGTARLVVDRTPPGTPLVLFPLGTENLLSRYMHHTSDPQQTVALVQQGAFQQMDVGLANGQLFLIVLGCGFDADVVHRVHSNRSGHIDRWTYAKPILKSIRSYDYPELRIYLTESGQAATWSCRWAFVVNLPCYAGGLNFVPSASGTDGRLNVCTFRQGSLWHGLRYLLSVFLGRHLKSSHVRTSAVATLRIEADGPVPYQLDGDPGGQLPVDIQVVPERMTLLTHPTKGHRPLATAGQVSS